jgi:hypothetical protein
LPRFEIPLRQHALFFARPGGWCQSPDCIFSQLCNVLQLSTAPAPRVALTSRHCFIGQGHAVQRFGLHIKPLKGVD